MYAYFSSCVIANLFWQCFFDPKCIEFDTYYFFIITNLLRFGLAIGPIVMFTVGTLFENNLFSNRLSEGCRWQMTDWTWKVWTSSTAAAVTLFYLERSRGHKVIFSWSFQRVNNLKSVGIKNICVSKIVCNPPKIIRILFW